MKSDKICVPTPEICRRFGLEIVEETKESYKLKCIGCGHVREAKKKVGGEINISKCKFCDKEQKKKKKELLKEQRAKRREDADRRKEIEREKHAKEHQDRILAQLYEEEERLMNERRDTSAKEYNRINTELNNVRMKIQSIIKDPDTHIEHFLPSMTYANNIPGIIPT